MCNILPNILPPVFMFAFIFHCRSFSPCWPLAFLIGRFYTRGRIIRLDELGQTFVARMVMRLKYKDEHKTHYASGRTVTAKYFLVFRISFRSLCSFLCVIIFSLCGFLPRIYLPTYDLQTKKSIFLCIS